MKSFTHNNLTKNQIINNSNSYILKANSKDRNMERERNPFDYNIYFNRPTGKYTFYYNENWWDTQTSKKKSKLVKVQNGAIINDKINEVKSLNITEMVIPRYIPQKNIGLKLDNIKIIQDSSLDGRRVTIYCEDQSRVRFISEDVNNIDNPIVYNFVEIILPNKERYYLFSNSDYWDLHIDIKRDYNLFENYYTDTLYFGDQLYIIDKIGENYIKLKTSALVMPSDLYLPEFYKNLLWNNGTQPVLEKKAITITNNDDIIHYYFIKNSVIEVSDENNKSIYFKIDDTIFDFDFSNDNGDTYNITKKYPNIHFNESEYEKIIEVIGKDYSMNVTAKINGDWLNTHNVEPDYDSYNGNVKSLYHYRPGMQDLLNEKLFYLSIDPFKPRKNLNTNQDINNVTGVFYPSTQATSYVFLTGQCELDFNHSDLRNLNRINFKFYYEDGTPVGDHLKDYPITYLDQRDRQLLLTMKIKQVSRNLT